MILCKSHVFRRKTDPKSLHIIKNNNKQVHLTQISKNPPRQRQAISGNMQNTRKGFSMSHIQRIKIMGLENDTVQYDFHNKDKIHTVISDITTAKIRSN